MDVKSVKLEGGSVYYNRDWSTDDIGYLDPNDRAPLTKKEFDQLAGDDQQKIVKMLGQLDPVTRQIVQPKYSTDGMTKKAKTAVINAVLGELLNGIAPLPDHFPKPDPEVADLVGRMAPAADGHKWDVIKTFRDKDGQLAFDAWFCRRPKGDVFSHGWRVRGTITDSTAKVEINRLADGFTSATYRVERDGANTTINGHQAKSVAPFTRQG